MEQQQVLETKINEILNPLGYELVALELQLGGQRRLRIFIDRRMDGATSPSPIGIEDCVAATRALDEPLEQLPEVEKLLKGSYELEVSSPGVDRPLRSKRDFERFRGKLARIHVFRPLNAEEIANAPYQEKNPRQKNFVGILTEVNGEKIVLALRPDPETQRKKKAQEAQKEEKVSIPLSLISKANLEPVFDFSETEDKGF